MNRTTHYIVMWLLLVGTTANIWSQDLENIQLEVKRIIQHDTEIDFDLTPGFVIGIIDQDSTFYLSFGSSNDEGKDLSSKDIFELGSITKLFTAALVDIACTQGIMNLDDDVNTYLPSESRNPRMEGVQIQDLLYHTSSLPMKPEGIGRKELDAQDPYRYYTKDDLLQYYKNFVPNKRKKFKYAHTNYALLEIILEEAFELDFDALLQIYLFEPIGMQSSFVTFKEKKKDVVTLGKDRSGSATKPWSFSSFAGSEGAKSSAEDLVAFMRAHISRINVMDGVLTDNFAAKKSSFEKKLKLSWGWQIVPVKKDIEVAIHTGMTDGHNCFIGMIPESETGVVVLSNSSIGTRDLGMLVLRLINYNWKRKT